MPYKLFSPKLITNACLRCEELLPSVLFLITVATPTPLFMGNMFQDHQWMPGTTNSTKPYIFYVFSYAYTPKIKFKL